MRELKVFGEKNNMKSNGMIYALVVLSLLSTIAAVVMGTLNAVQVPGLFNNSIGYLSAKYYNEATPAGFVFGTVWPIIYLFILAGSIYLFASIFLPVNQSPVNNVPTLTPKSFLLGSILGCLATVAWLFAFDRELLIPSFAILIFGAMSLWEAVRSSLVVVYDNLPQLETNSRTMLLVMRILIHNGLSIFATWLTLATVLGFTIALIYVDSPGMDSAQLRGLVSQETGSTIGLAIIFVFVIAMFILENFVYEPYFRYVFSIFPVFVLALTGVVVHLSSTGAYRNLQLASIELGVSVVCSIVRIVLSVFKLTSPSDQYYPTKSSMKKELLANVY